MPKLPLVSLFALAFSALCLLGLAHHFEASGEPVARTPSGSPPIEGRLIIFWIDALNIEDVEEGRFLPHLTARLPNALHGRVRECLDAVSVPCFLAMTTGEDSVSLVALGANFAGTKSVDERSVLSQAKARGLRIGFSGDSLVAPALGEIDWVATFERPDDEGTLEAAVEALDRERLDVLIVHFREADFIAHRKGGAAPEYGEALLRLDGSLEEARLRLRPEDHVVVLGDHGHDERGRHLAGLDVPTYAVYTGPRFARPLERAMLLTDHARIFAHLLGASTPHVPWVDAYFAGEPLEASRVLPSR